MAKDKLKVETQVDEPPKSVNDLGKPDYTGPTFISSVDLTTPEGIKMALNSRSEPDLRAEDMEGEIFPVVHWIVSRQHYDGKGDEEERDGIRIVFFDADGRTLSCSSEAVGRWMDDLFNLVGRGPYDPPVEVAITKTVSRGGRPTYKIRV